MAASTIGCSVLVLRYGKSIIAEKLTVVVLSLAKQLMLVWSGMKCGEYADACTVYSSYTTCIYTHTHRGCLAQINRQPP